jgi:hypothetical protein
MERFGNDLKLREDIPKILFLNQTREKEERYE